MKPLKFILSDVGGVLMHVDRYGREHALSRQYGLDPRALRELLYDERLFHALERGTLGWEVYRETRLAHLRAMGAALEEDAEGRFDATWVSILREPVMPVARMWLALRNRLEIVSVSNVDPVSYEYGVRHHAMVAGCFSRDDTHSFRFGRRKGDDDYFPALLERLDAHPEECLFVDDLREHVVAAKRYGMDVVWMREISEGSLLELRLRLIERGVDAEALPEGWAPGPRC